MLHEILFSRVNFILQLLWPRATLAFGNLDAKFQLEQISSKSVWAVHLDGVLAALDLVMNDLRDMPLSKSAII